MRKLVRLTALIAALLVVSGAPVYAHGGGARGGGVGTPSAGHTVASAAITGSAGITASRGIDSRGTTGSTAVASSGSGHRSTGARIGTHSGRTGPMHTRLRR